MIGDFTLLFCFVLFCSVKCFLFFFSGSRTCLPEHGLCLVQPPQVGQQHRQVVHRHRRLGRALSQSVGVDAECLDQQTLGLLEEPLAVQDGGQVLLALRDLDGALAVDDFAQLEGLLWVRVRVW